ncbi:serine/threonine-protein kinase [Polyangium aurulentum]|uniref:serine/threonine-protein kinase n=1 Tax=Polyangium aurulentum TaxID=2567896 RepID=UPI0010AE26F4|nr:serine/threonine-protein kinase [Polyangium aurulentum]UQA62626.1 serine/threonine-protein kinase [Polyangium aurulentum]
MSSGLPESIRRLLARPEDERRIGSYRLKRQLGQGGFAPVWLADEIAGSTTLRQAAVKLFSLDASTDERVRQEIIDEAERLCRVEHPNIVRFYALPLDEARGVVGLAMEYVAGETLAQRLRDREQLTLKETIDVGIALASALVAVHGAGLVHRDVTPLNVVVNGALVGSPAAYKLIDFGIAAATPRRVITNGASGRAPFSSDPAISRERPSHEPLVGKRGYVDPVCWRDRSPATSASDLYALGAVLFICLAGRIPAAGGGALDEDVLTGKKRATRISMLVSDLPAALVDLIDALLDPEPEARPRSAELVVVELERLRGTIAGGKRALPTEDEGPFRGLGRFEQQHRDVFFGRRVEVAAAIEALRTRGLCALVGPSGTGKSSLARAGILPALEEGALGGPRRWESVVVSPDVDPRQVLTTRLFHMGLDPSKPPADAVARIEEWIGGERRGLVLLVDQLEEIATLEKSNDGLGESRAWTMDFLARLGERPFPGLRVIVTARRDLLDPILAHRALGHVMMRGTVLVSPLGGAAWGEVIDAALESYGYAFEDATLRKDLLDSLAATADAMPLVEFALTKLWEERDRKNKRITRAGWQKLRGIAGALDDHAEATLALVTKVGVPEVVAQRVLLALTTPGGARMARPVSALTDGGRDGHAERVVRIFEEARLVVREGERRGSGDRVTLAHEALLLHWRRLRKWVEDEREERLLIDDFAQAASLWDDRKHDDLLWGRRRLLLLQEVLRLRSHKLDGAEKRFFQASQWASRRSRLVAGVVGAVIAVGAIAGGGAYLRAEARRAIAEAAAEREKSLRVEAEKREQERAREALEAYVKLREALGQQAQRTPPEQMASALDAGAEAGVVVAVVEPPKPAVPALLDPGTIGKIEDYLAERERAQEPVPEPLADLLKEDLDLPPLPAPTAVALAPTAVPLPPGSVVTPVLQKVPRDIVLGEAYSALGKAKQQAAACRRDDGPHGPGKLALVIDPNGSVSSVAIENPYTGTTVAPCVDGIFRRVRVSPFEGKPIPVIWSFSIP